MEIFNEEKLLLSMLSGFINKKKLKLDVENISFNRFYFLLDLNLLYGIIPYKNRHFPLWVRENIRKETDATLRHSMVLLEELSQVSRVFGKYSINYMLFKGSSLSLNIYQSLASRRTKDIDILIAKKDLQRAAMQIQKLGYRPDLFYSGYHQRFGNQTRYIKNNGSCIELHSEVIEEGNPFRLDSAKLLSGKKEFYSRSMKLFEPMPEDHIIIMSASSYYHHNFINCLRSMIDIGLLIRKKKIDILSALRKAEEYKAAYPFGCSLRFLRDYLGFTEIYFQGNYPDIFRQFFKVDNLASKLYFGIRKIAISQPEKRFLNLSKLAYLASAKTTSFLKNLL